MLYVLLAIYAISENRNHGKDIVDVNASGSVDLVNQPIPEVSMTLDGQTDLSRYLFFTDDGNFLVFPGWVLLSLPSK